MQYWNFIYVVYTCALYICMSIPTQHPYLQAEEPYVSVSIDFPAALS